MAGTAPETGYAPVGELEMYYELHGSGPPLVVLHGAYMTAEMMAPLVSGLSGSHRVVVPEQQGHGRTADADRPIAYEQMADDTAALIRHLGLDAPDVVGYSMGAATALQLAIRHPGVVSRLVVASGSFSSDGIHRDAWEMFPSISPEMFAGSPMEQEYQRIAPDPGSFPELVRKLKALDTTPYAWPEEDVRAIAAPVLLVFGDSDVVTLEHATELFRLVGGGVMGDLSGMPASRLAVLPGTSHFIPPGHGVLDRAEWLLPMIATFLEPTARDAG